MDRRLFLATLGGTGIAAAVPHSNLYASSSLRYPLLSVPDEGTHFDQAKAARVRKLAEYVITRDKQPGLIYFDKAVELGTEKLKTAQIVLAAMVIGGQRYSIRVINADEQEREKFNSRNYSIPELKKMFSLAYFTDSMSIWSRPDGTQGVENRIQLVDLGLDSICNIGYIPAKFSSIGKKIVFDSGLILPRGLEHRQEVQKLFDNSIDALLAFYEGPRTR